MNEVTSSTSCTTRTYCGGYQAHSHGFSQILFGLEGCLELDIEGRNARVDAATGLVVPAGYVHGYSCKTDSRVWVVDTPMGKGLDKIRPFRLPSQWQVCADPLTALECIGGAPRVLQRREMHPYVLANKVRHSLHESWSTQRMSNVYTLSVPQFHRRWKELLGITPQVWLRGVRFDAALVQLRSGCSLDATATAVGYRSGSALCYALQRDRGTGARALRAVVQDISQTD